MENKHQNKSKEELIHEVEVLQTKLKELRREQATFKVQRNLLEDLVAMARTPSAGGVLKTALQSTIDVATDLTKSEKGSMFLLDPDSGRVVDAILSRTEVTNEQRKKLIGSVLDKGLAGWVIRHRKLGLIEDTDTDDRWLTLPNQPYIVRSALGIPILRGEELLGIITLLHSQPGHFNSESANLMQVTADQMALVLENARLYNKVDEYGKALNNELEKGRQIQLDFLPDRILQPPNWEISACFYPAKQVAGDFYDVFELGDYIGLVIADVCDKGVGAALFMALMRSLIRIFARQTLLRGFSVIPYEELVAELDENSEDFNLTQVIPLEAVLLTNNYVAEEHWKMSMFATMFFGILDPQTGNLTYINGGHEPLSVLNKDGIKQVLKSTGPAVGMMPNQKFKIHQIKLEPGDILFGYTDGVSEAKNPDGKLFGEANIRELLIENHQSASELLEFLKAKLFAYIADAAQFDDITMIAVQRKF